MKAWSRVKDGVERKTRGGNDEKNRAKQGGGSS